MKLSLTKTTYASQEQLIAAIKTLGLPEKLEYKKAFDLADAKGETIAQHLIDNGTIVIELPAPKKADTTSGNSDNDSDNSDNESDNESDNDTEEMSTALGRAINKIIAAEMDTVSKAIAQLDVICKPLSGVLTTELYEKQVAIVKGSLGLTHSTAIKEVNHRIDQGALKYKDLVITRELIEKAKEVVKSPVDQLNDLIERFTTDNKTTLDQIAALVAGIYADYEAQCKTLGVAPSLTMNFASGVISFVNKAKSSNTATTDRVIVNRTVRTSDELVVKANLNLEKKHSSGKRATFVSDDTEWTITNYGKDGTVRQVFNGLLQETSTNLWKVKPSSATKQVYSDWTSAGSNVSAPKFWGEDFFVGQVSPTATN